MKIRHYFTLGFCLLAFGFSQKIYAQDMGAVDEAAVDEAAVVESDEEESNEAVKRPNIFVRTVNFFMNLPFGYDLGCEPTLHGSLTYFNLKYRWSDEKQIFSRLNFYYGTTLNITPKEKGSLGAEVKKYQKEQKAFDFRLIPWGKQINYGKEKKSFFTIEPGLNFRIEPEKTEASIAYKPDEADEFVILDMKQDRNRFIVRPFYSTSMFTPVGKPFSVTMDLLYSPIYFYWGKNKITLTADIYDAASKSLFIEANPTLITDYTGYAENYFDVNMIFGFFNFVALSGRLIYERNHKTDYDYVPSGENIGLSSKDNTYETLTLKAGGSLINIGKASMRIKAGVFYQWEWEYNHNSDTWEKDGKWIFGVGMRNLY